MSGREIAEAAEGREIAEAAVVAAAAAAAAAKEAAEKAAIDATTADASARREIAELSSPPSCPRSQAALARTVEGDMRHVACTALCLHCTMLAFA